MLRLQSALRRSGRLLQPRGAHRCLVERPLEALLPTHVRNLLGTTPPPEKVFANRELRMADVKAIGFDYDYTLASYTTELNSFIYDRAKEHLMERSHYPAIDTSYDPSFAIRGLLFDRRTGYLVKLSYARAVAQDAAFLGRRRLTTEELHRAYGPALHCDPHRVADDMSQSMWKSTSVSGARRWRGRALRRAVRNRHRHAIKQVSRRWRGGRGDSGPTHRKFDFHTGRSLTTSSR